MLVHAPLSVASNTHRPPPLPISFLPRTPPFLWRLTNTPPFFLPRLFVWAACIQIDESALQELDMRNLAMMSQNRQVIGPRVTTAPPLLAFPDLLL